MLPQWEVRFDNGVSLYAWFDPNDPQGSAVKIQWRENNKPKHGPLYVHLADGPELMQSFAAFVAAIRLANAPQQAKASASVPQFDTTALTIDALPSAETP